MVDVAALDAAYRATTYAAGAFVLHIGDRCTALDAILPSACPEWAFVTAFNPGSVQREEAANQRDQTALETTLTAAGYDYLPGHGTGTDWPAEASVLILGITESDACRYARPYGQLAIVCGRRGEPARLVWLI